MDDAARSGRKFHLAWCSKCRGISGRVLGILSRKIWLRLREFMVLSWPMLIAGSVVLGLASHFGWDRLINLALLPLTRLLGLPFATGTTLIFGLLRKELTLIMLTQALGTTHINQVMTTAQIVGYTLFITFYMPCLATMAALAREVGKKLTTLCHGLYLRPGGVRCGHGASGGGHFAIRICDGEHCGNSN